MVQLIKLCFLLSAALAAKEESFILNPNASGLYFLATGTPSLMRIKGEGAKLNGKIVRSDNELRGEFFTSLDSLEAK